MVSILGINPGPDHDTSACILCDGKLVAAAEQERFNREKHTREFPFRAISFCLKFAHMNIEEIDYIAIPWAPNKFMGRFLSLMLRNPSIESLYNLVTYLPYSFKYQQEFYLKRGLKFLPKIKYIPHHHAHACTAFYCSGFSSSSVVTVDAVGENSSTVSWEGDGKKLTKIREEPYRNSLGEIYTAVTEYLGFRPYSGEGKTMGLAPYGSNQDRIVKCMKKIIDSENGRWYKVNPDIYFLPGYRKNLKILSQLFGYPNRTSQSPLENVYPHIAYEVQTALERALINVVRDTIAFTDIADLCLAGGVALNCKSNAEIRKNASVENFFAFPAANDAGTAVGAAMALAATLGEDPLFKMEHSYFGPKFTNETIESIMEERSLKYEYHKNIPRVCAELLSQGKVIGWFQGRMELGPRALGNRSILADPRDRHMKEKVNRKVKKREHWRPFCPSMLSEAKDEYLVDACEAPFMILAFDVPKPKIREIPAVVHVDGTTRPQTVKREINSIYWDLIKRFEEETGIPMVLNTSFNLAGEPIVCTPNDAIRTFYDSGMDCLALGDYLLMK